MRSNTAIGGLNKLLIPRIRHSPGFNRQGTALGDDEEHDIFGKGTEGLVSSVAADVRRLAAEAGLVASEIKLRDRNEVNAK